MAPEALAAALEQHGVVERTVVYGSPAYLASLKAINPRIRLLAPLGSGAALEALARDLKPYAVDARWEILSRELIARCHVLGIRVFSDALGQHERIEEYQKAMDWGIDLIQTDHPLRLMRAIELRIAGASPGAVGSRAAERSKR
jgi:glycerophosphoryl diester phosphodiesterase